MNNKNLLTKYLQILKEHKPIIINFGKGSITDDDIKAYCKWNGENYEDEDGIPYGIDTMIEIAKDEVPGMSLEEICKTAK